MYNIRMHPQRSRPSGYALVSLFAFLTLILPPATRAQNVDSLVQVVNHSQSADAINNAKKNLPEYVRKINMKILDVIGQMKAQGINRGNVAKQQVHDRFSSSLVELDDLGNVHVKIYLTQMSESSIEKLKALGISVEYADQSFKRVTCKIPFDVVETLAKDDNVTGIYNVGKPHVNVGTYTTAGDHILGADVTRSTYGVNGSGIKVGIISDGVNHWTSSRDHGDLPSTFQVINNRIGGDEGTAMSEIVYDIASGASLAFADEGYDDADFANNITLLRNAGCNVIVDDISWSDEPMFEDGTIAQAVDQATAAGVKYVSAAGSDATETWDGQSVDANGNTWMEFSGSDETNSVAVEPNEQITVISQWANKWNNSHDDFDLYVFDGPSPTSNVLASSTNSGIAYEFAQWTNSGSTSKTVYIRVKYHSVQSNREVKLVVWKKDWWDQLHYTTEHGVWGHAAASSCVSVGAIGASDGQTLEQFSSHGPSRIYSYDANGNPVSYVDRATPTICGIDGVQTYVGMSGLWYPHPTNYVFYGTSAAAPHIAGISALVLSLPIFSNLTWQQVEQKITSTATKVSGINGQNFTNAYGYGRTDAYQSERNVYSNATVASGTTLQLNSGASLAFASGVSLTVNGTLNATSATFDRNGSSNWGGIIFNSGSSGSLSYCNINNGSPGVKCNGVLPSISHCTFNVNSMALWLNSVGSPSTHISGNSFYNQNAQGQAISCYYSSPQIDGGT